MAASQKGAEGKERAGRRKLHQEVKDHLEFTNASYKAVVDAHRWFKEYIMLDMVIVHLQKSLLPTSQHRVCLGVILK